MQASSRRELKGTFDPVRPEQAGVLGIAQTAFASIAASSAAATVARSSSNRSYVSRAIPAGALPSIRSTVFTLGAAEITRDATAWRRS